MNIAIMGAGLSGLACAITLEKNGIIPTIFEKRSQVGDRFVNGEIILSALYRPIRDPIAYLSEQHGIYIQPLANVSKALTYSENHVAQINGNLGFITIRGRDYDSLENQLARQIKSKIICNSEFTYEQLLKDFTHVIVATGDGAYSTKIQDYKVDLTVTLKGATVVGKFDRYTLMTWFDYKIIPQGYGYLIPFSETEANLVIGYPDYPQNVAKDINYIWDKFYERICQDLKQVPKITDQFEITRFIIGICQYPRIGNTFFTGNCFGSMMPYLGFGQIEAILTGIDAAKDLCGLGKYAELTKKIRKSYSHALTLRRTLEQLDNPQLDFMIKSLDGKLGQLVFNNNRLNALKMAGYLLRPFLLTNPVK